MRTRNKLATAAAAIFLVTLAAVPANAAYAATVEDGACDGVAIRDTHYASTGPTTYATCSLHGVNAKIQPAGAGGAYWTGWKWRSGTASYSTSGGVPNSSHSVRE